MPTINFKKNYKSIETNTGETLMETLLKNELPVASSCGGDGVCAKCKIKILDGQNNLTPLNLIEKNLLREIDFKRNYRLSCQVKVLGDIVIDTNYW